MGREGISAMEAWLRIASVSALIISLSPTMPLPGDLDPGMGCEVLGITWGVIPGVGPGGLGSSGGSPLCLLPVVTVSVASFNSTLAVHKQIA